MEPIIEFSDAKIYQQGHLILSDINLSLNKGEFAYLIGKTGTGKSSLLRTLYCDLPLLEGNATIAEFDLAKIKSKQIPYLRRKLGIVFQDFQLLNDRNIEKNLEFAMQATGWKNKDEIKTRIKDVLDKVSLGTKGFKMPFELSGGEQQRVAIARALINNPDVILADEPTGNLDPQISEDIIKLLIDISKAGKAVIVATHDYVHFSKFPSRTIKCENGKVIPQST
jgi:cell division transport system ATP-binding protein